MHLKLYNALKEAGTCLYSTGRVDYMYQAGEFSGFIKILDIYGEKCANSTCTICKTVAFAISKMSIPPVPNFRALNEKVDNLRTIVHSILNP